MNIKKNLKVISALTAVALGTASLTACSLPKFGKQTATETLASTAEATLSPEQAIIGTWEVKTVTDPSGKEVSVSDINLSGTPLESMSGIIGSILKQGVKLNFKSDNTVSLSIFSGNYTLADDTLEISIPQLSQSFKLPCKIEGNTLKAEISSYTATLTKE